MIFVFFFVEAERIFIANRLTITRVFLNGNRTEQSQNKRKSIKSLFTWQKRIGVPQAND